MAEPEKVTFDFIKSNQFRVIHVDGAHGGIVANGNIHMALFSERSPIPKQVTHAVGDDKTVGPEIVAERVIRPALAVREVEVSVLMNREVARALYQWLGRHLRRLDALDAGSGSDDPGEDPHGQG